MPKKLYNEFQYKKNGEYTGEPCPECEREMYLNRGKGTPWFLVCHCGFSVPTKEYVRCMYFSMDVWHRYWEKHGRPGIGDSIIRRELKLDEDEEIDDEESIQEVPPETPVTELF